MIRLSNSNLFLVGGSTGISTPSKGEQQPVDVAELVSSFGFSADFNPLFRELVITFGVETE